MCSPVLSGHQFQCTVLLSSVQVFAWFVFQGRLSASGVGSLVGLQSEQIQNIAAHYADKVCQFLILEMMMIHI